ncbi:MAG TPA: sigma factor, partial [Desulfobacterales bacterium]|nr:sigma factor [Desulfobacterales bacterium]
MEADHLEQIWHDYAARLKAFIRGRIGDAAEADDVLQEVFLRIHTGLCCREAATHLARWIYRATRNLIVDR